MRSRNRIAMTRNCSRDPHSAIRNPHSSSVAKCRGADGVAVALDVYEAAQDVLLNLMQGVHEAVHLSDL
eukprot:8064328-Alexandrium_andersonii.AAC.1